MVVPRFLTTMVSTRGARCKYAEGERVLCYEPDPTKAKVLYDSKVLEVIETKDRRGRRSLEYLIHFQGWNSSWDRCVSEDFVLKDTEENRQLQRDLAERSQLQLGAYLYRRERKKGAPSGAGGAAPPKRSRHSGSGHFEDEGSSSSTQQDGEGEGEGVPDAREPREGEGAEGTGAEAERADATDSSSSGAGAARTPRAHAAGRAHIALPAPLRDRLTFDFHLVVKRGRLSALPASPCVADILEAFVRWYARAGARSPPAAAGPRPNLTDVSRRLNLVREVADGLRIYFDHVLRGHLLYKQELNQYHDLVGRFIDSPGPVVKVEKADLEPEGGMDEVAEPKIKVEPPEIKEEPEEPMETEGGEAEGEATGELGPDADNSEAAQPPENNTNMSGTEELLPVKEEPRSDVAAVGAVEGAPRVHKKEKRELKADSVARRLRSQKGSVTSPGEAGGGAGGSAGGGGDEPAPSTSAANDAEPTIDRRHDSVGSSGSSAGEGWWGRPRRALAPHPPHPPPPAPPAPRPLDPPAAPPRNPLALLLDKVAQWSIIPREGTEHLPCRIYGAIHLSRLFVKLPDFLNAVHMPDVKLKLLLHYIDMFVQYLDEHREWFGETYYMSDSMSRSH